MAHITWIWFIPGNSYFRYIFSWHSLTHIQHPTLKIYNYKIIWFANEGELTFSNFQTQKIDFIHIFQLEKYVEQYGKQVEHCEKPKCTFYYTPRKLFEAHLRRSAFEVDRPIENARWLSASLCTVSETLFLSLVGSVVSLNLVKEFVGLRFFVKCLYLLCVKKIFKGLLSNGVLCVIFWYVYNFCCGLRIFPKQQYYI